MTNSTSVWLGKNPDLSNVWPELIAGRAQVTGCGATQAGLYLQLSPQPARPTRNKLAAHRVRILERVLLGEVPKVVAMEIGCSLSTVATAVANCLRAMGMNRTTNRVPPLLVLALHAMHGRAGCSAVRVERLPGESPDLQLSSNRLELYLSDAFTASEVAVVGLVVEGYSHAEIAARRNTSARTVANQIASVYKKLNVSGRIELICCLISRLEAVARRERCAKSAPRMATN